MANMQQKFNAGQTHGQAQGKAEEWIESAKQTANVATDKASNAAQSAQESAQQHGHHQQGAGFLQQTGEQVAHMAQGAVDTVKNTLGINEKNK